jgi:hypothetical protein
MRAAWRGELLKIATVRGQLVALFLAVVAIPLTSLLVAASGQLGQHDTATAGAATGSVIGILGFGSWGAVVAASEYSCQTMLVSLTTVPRRTVFYGAKLAAVASAAAAGSVLSAVLSFVAVLAATPRRDHHVGDPVALLAIALAVVAVTAVGVAAGLLTRSPAASIAIIFAVVLLPQTAGGLLGGLQPWVVGATPGVVITEIVGNSQLAADQTYPPGAAAAAVTLLALSAAIAFVGGWSMLRRDGR